MSGNAQRPNSMQPTNDNTVALRRSSPSDHTETQRSLQEASMALETAFNRIRQVRRSLVQLSDSLPPMPEMPTPSRLAPDGIRPNHDALLLSGGRMQVDDAYGELFIMPPPLPPSNSGRDSAAASAIRQRLALYSNTTSTQPSPPLPSVMPPRLMRHGMIGHPQTTPGGVPAVDQAATTRGLRVAAREADPTLRGSSLHDIGNDFASLTLEYERLIAQHRRIMDGAINLQNRLPPRASVAARAQQVREATVRAGPNGQPSPAFLAGAADARARLDARRTRLQLPRANGRMITIDPAMTLSERFTAVTEAYNREYGPPRQALPPPQMPGGFPPPPSEASPRPAPPAPPRARPPPPPQPAPYVPTFMDDELTGNPDWTDEEFISWLFPAHDYASTLMSSRDPANPDTIRITRTTDTSISPADDEMPRRGWARLDPDGNEIPPDEEEDLERARTEHRIRALRVRQNPITQVPLNMRQSGRTIYGTIMDATMSVPAPSRRERHPAPPPTQPAHVDVEPYRPFYVNPLPMPLESMVMAIQNPQEDCYPDVIVPRHACLAGR